MCDRAMKMYTYSIHTFGCQMNVGDSQWLKRALQTRGLKESLANLENNITETTDIVILYTCSVRDKPEQRVYQIISRLQHIHRNNPHFVIAVGGCVAQQIGTSLLEKFPSVRLVFGTDSSSYIPDAIVQVLENSTAQISLLDFVKEYPERDFTVATTDIAPIEYVNIMQGCDNYCTYCIVPFTRGRQKSRSCTEILRECSLLVENGVQEIVLLGQNVNAYGMDSGEVSFSELLTHITEIEGIQRLSFMTPHPKDFDDATIALFAKKSILSPRIHLPMQSGSDAILQAMGRQYTRKDYSTLVEKIRAVRSDAVFSTDIIVAFPGETEEDFLDSITLMQDIGFALSFSFCYSDRPGTKASELENTISKEIALERLTRLQAVQTSLREEYLASYRGKIIDVLFENTIKKQDSSEGIVWYGKDVYGTPVKAVLPEGLDATGETYRVYIAHSTRHNLYGEYNI